MSRTKHILSLGLALVFASAAYCQNFSIIVDYSLDTNNFFSTQARRDAMQAAADRWSNIITSQLTAVGPGGTVTGTPQHWRIGFNHPGTGLSHQISTAPNSGVDDLVLAGAPAANQYGFAGLAANEWRLFAGGRAGLPGGAAGVGGTGTGFNFSSTFDDLQGPMHRGVISNTPGAGQQSQSDIPAWGGSISFNTGTTWHFGISTAAPGGTTDFYSIALHEIGHALGLSISFNQWNFYQSATNFTGPKALSAFNQDNGASATFLSTQSVGPPANLHWADGVHDSFIFSLGGPNLAGTVGLNTLQDLLMEPIANFTGSLRRFELTNVDIGALQDMGWAVLSVPEPSTYLMIGCVLAFAGYGYSRRKTSTAKDEVATTEETTEPLPSSPA